jgi:hypothetical protein
MHTEPIILSYVSIIVTSQTCRQIIHTVAVCLLRIVSSLAWVACSIIQELAYILDRLWLAAGGDRAM